MEYVINKAFFTVLFLIIPGNIVAFLTNDKLPQYQQFGKCLVLVGGNLEDDNTEVYNTIIRMAGGPGKAKIGIITAANADPTGSYAFYSNLFVTRYGALSAARIPIDVNHTSQNYNPEVVSLIRQQTGFFFGGGDQYRVVQSFFPQPNRVSSPALSAIRERYEKGAVISGTSAGTTCQTSTLMVRDGVSYNAVRYGSYTTITDKHPDDLVYDPNGGIGMFDNFVLDTHFSQRGRQGRMIRLLVDTRTLTKGSNRGIGVDENTALVITHAQTKNVSGMVIGVNGVSFFDVSRVQMTNSPLLIRDVYMHYLTHGDSINLDTLNVTFSPSKSPMNGHEAYIDALTSDDVFSGSRTTGYKPEFIRIATSIFDARRQRNTYGDTHEQQPGYRVELSSIGKLAEGWVERKSSFHTDVTSFKNMYIEIKAQS